MALAQVTGDPVWDGIGTLVIGVLLGVIAITLAIEMKSLLIGEGRAARATHADAGRGGCGARCRAAHPHAHRVPRARRDAGRGEGPVRGDARPSAELADAIDRTESAIREAEPIARVIYLEPDLFDPDRVDSPDGPSTDEEEDPEDEGDDPEDAEDHDSEGEDEDDLDDPEDDDPEDDPDEQAEDGGETVEGAEDKGD